MGIWCTVFDTNEGSYAALYGAKCLPGKRCSDKRNASGPGYHTDAQMKVGTMAKHINASASLKGCAMELVCLAYVLAVDRTNGPADILTAMLGCLFQ